jgi:hypothetical protein
VSAWFVGGPLDGMSLDIGRAPHYLRVVVDEQGNVDALDELDDVPRPGERVAVYVRPGESEAMHVDYRDGKRAARWIVNAAYVHLADVEGEDLRDTAAWRAWVRAQPPAGIGRLGETRWPLPEGITG